MLAEAIYEIGGVSVWKLRLAKYNVKNYRCRLGENDSQSMAR